MMKKAKLPSLVSILILTLITVVVWVTFDVYRLFNKIDTPVVPESVSQPLIPTFDTETINAVESKSFLDELQVTDQVTTINIQTEPDLSVPNQVDETAPNP